MTAVGLLKEVLKGIVIDVKENHEQELDELLDLAIYRFFEDLGGIQIYVPNQEKINQRNRLIKREFKGNNILHLSRKYGVSMAWIYQILKSKEGENEYSNL